MELGPLETLFASLVFLLPATFSFGPTREMNNDHEVACLASLLLRY